MRILLKLSFLLFFSSLSIAMEHESLEPQTYKTVIVVAPGMNGNYGFVYKFCKDKNVWIHEVPKLPLYNVDFGQSVSQSYLRSTLDPVLADENVDNIILYFNSLSTSAGINYLANNHHDKIKAVIFDAVMTSTGRSFSHVLKMLSESAEELPPSLSYAARIVRGLGKRSRSFLSHVVLPFVVPFYNLNGEQPIFNLHKLPRDIPLIMLHCEGDVELPFAGALEMYGKLETMKFENVYFISSNKAGHLSLGGKENQRAVYKILGVCNPALFLEDPDKANYLESDLTPYRPEYWSLLNRIMQDEEELEKDEYSIELFVRFISYAIKAGLVCYSGLPIDGNGILTTIIFLWEISRYVYGNLDVIESAFD